MKVEGGFADKLTDEQIFVLVESLLRLKSSPAKRSLEYLWGKLAQYTNPFNYLCITLK